MSTDEPVPDDEREVEPAVDEDPGADGRLVETAHDATGESGTPVIEVDAERRV